MECQDGQDHGGLLGQERNRLQDRERILHEVMVTIVAASAILNECENDISVQTTGDAQLREGEDGRVYGPSREIRLEMRSRPRTRLIHAGKCM